MRFLKNLIALGPPSITTNENKLGSNFLSTIKTHYYEL